MPHLLQSFYLKSYRALAGRLCLGALSLLGGTPSLANEYIQINGHEHYYQAELRRIGEELNEQNFVRYSSQHQTVEYRPIKIVIVDFDIYTPPVQKFIRALETEKDTLMQLYGLDNYVYNELAQMTVGILGNESKFFESPLYAVVSTLPDDWNYNLKRFQNFLSGEPETSALSKGPTRMKDIPALIGQHYGIQDKEQLEDPFIAAVATLGYLAAAREELLIKIKHYEMGCVNESNFFDMLLYLYFGGSSYRRKLIECKVDPRTNVYIRNSHLHRQTVVLFEQQP